MSKIAVIGILGGLVPLLLLDTVARADWRTPISGGEKILPTTFTPMPGVRFVDPDAVLPGGHAPSQAAAARPMSPPRTRRAHLPAVQVVEPVAATPSDADDVAMPAVSVPLGGIPLVDRRLSAARKSADLGGDLQDAIARMEPIFDPTRLDGTWIKKPLAIWAGTASMDNVFADHWRVADTDPNVHADVAYIAMAWHLKGTEPCDAFYRSRTHQYGDPALTEMTEADCARLARRQALGFSRPPAVPIVGAPLSLPVFAAPLPGARMTSQDFWALQRARMEAISAHLHQRWETRTPTAGPIRDAQLRP